MKKKHIIAETLGAVLEERRETRGSGTGEWDWLGYAVHKLGGPAKAATTIGVSLRTLHTYLGEGLSGAPFREIILISKLADVPIDYLARRMGPPEEHHFARKKSRNRKAA
jgi:hypothetical protein